MHCTVALKTNTVDYTSGLFRRGYRHSNLTRSGSRIPLRRGRQPSRRGRQPTIVLKISQKLHEIEKILGRWGRACSGGTPLDLPLLEPTQYVDKFSKMRDLSCINVAKVYTTFTL